jgi:Tetratricopeptide repeat
MNRSELERLDRDTLIARAEESGVTRARILTRPELIDELLLRASGASGRPDDMARVRGLFGRARDLLTRVIERGLHLPDAAERLRERLSLAPLAPEAPLPTVTLAEIYAAQGHRGRAVATLKGVLEREPDHAAARRLIAQLEDAGYAGPEPAALPPEDEIFAPRPPSDGPSRAAVEGEALDGAEDLGDVGAWDELVEDDDEPTDVHARAYARSERSDECVAIPVDRETVFVYWDVSERTRTHLERARPGGTLVVRALVVVPTWDGPASSVRDAEVDGARGDSLLTELPAGAVVRTAIGWRIGEGLIPIACSPALEAFERNAEGAVTTVARWTMRGLAAVDGEDRDAGSIERAFEAIRARAKGEEGRAEG